MPYTLLIQLSKGVWYNQTRHSFEKIQKLNLSVKFYKLLESYLCNRYMKVQIDDALSEASKVEKGVPQGSFLGLFFFVLFVDDLLFDTVYFSSYLFADDLFLLYTGPNNPANRLKSDLCQLQTWSEFNFFFFKFKKCQNLILKGSLGFEPELYNEKLIKTDVCTDLGLVSNLKWNNHLETRLSKAHNVYQMVRRNSPSNTSIQAMLLVYKSMVIPSPLFDSECWFPKKSELRKLKSFNSRVTGWIISRDDYKQRLATLRNLPIS